MDSQEAVLENIKRSVVVDGCRFISPEFVETNSAIIVFAGGKAFKILKKGREGIDCSTVFARRNLLAEELESNSEMNTDLYFGISSVSICDGQIIIGGSDSVSVQTVVDYALCMKRLEQRFLVYNMLLNGSYRDEITILIAKTLAVFHRRKLSGEIGSNDHNLIRKFSTVESLIDIVERDFQMFERLRDIFIPAVTTEQKYQEIKRYIVGFLKSRRALFLERIRLGRVLPIHGDFHSRNIFVENNVVYMIDRSLRRNMRVSDILKDVAYFAVDLEIFGCQKSKEMFLDAYRSAIPDEYFMQLLPFYMCRRAFVAGLVNHLEEDAERLKSYFDLAYNYAVSG